MYSYEERIKAVRLYLKLGKRLRATIRQLGYPTKNSLIGWYREYLKKQDLKVGYTRSGWKYSAAQQQVAVQHFLRAWPLHCVHAEGPWIPLQANADCLD